MICRPGSHRKARQCFIIGPWHEIIHATNSVGNICFQSLWITLNSASSAMQAKVSNRSPHLQQHQRFRTSHSLTNSDQSGINSNSPHLTQVVPWSVLLIDGIIAMSASLNCCCIRFTGGELPSSQLICRRRESL